MTAMRVYLGSDHAGYELKQAIIEHLESGGHEPIDCGAYVYDAEDDYPAFCIAAAEKTLADPGSLGIVIGGSGNGEQIAANKVPGVRAALCNDLYTARLSREHNDANVLTLGSGTIDNTLMQEIVRAWLSTEIKEQRHKNRVAKIVAIEQQYVRK